MRAILRRKLCELRSEGFVGPEVPEEMFSDGDGENLPTPSNAPNLSVGNVTPNSPGKFPPTVTSPTPAENFSIGFSPSPSFENLQPTPSVNSPGNPPKISAKISRGYPQQNSSDFVTKNMDFSAKSFGLSEIIPEILSE